MLDRVLSKINENRYQILKQGESFQKRLDADLVNALNLRYSTVAGLEADDFEFASELFSGSISLISEGIGSTEPSTFDPPAFVHQTTRIEPIEVIFTRWATLMVFRVSLDDPGTRLRLNWYRKSDRMGGPVYIVDEEDSGYYYPISSSLTGEVLPGHPKTGIMAFELFKKPTGRFSIQFSNVQVAKGKGGRQSFSFLCCDERCRSLIATVLRAPTLSTELKGALDAEADRLKNLARREHSGCVWVALSLLTAVAGAGLAVLALLVGLLG